MYIGRFAPSPTGPLHFGSLLAALASYLDAKHHQGLWHLRIENIDPPREKPLSEHRIPDTLETLGFEWDGPLVWQSDRDEAYQTALNTLINQQRVYNCDCSRKEIQLRSGHTLYDGHCRHRDLPFDTEGALRLYAPAMTDTWQDRIQGEQPQVPCEDFVLRRKDGLWSYHLAMVVDDQALGVTDVVRGFDLLPESPKQMALMSALGFKHPRYAHIPVATALNGQKLSKQNLAPAIMDEPPVPLLVKALEFLHQDIDANLHLASPAEILAWAIPRWDITRLPQRGSQPIA